MDLGKGRKVRQPTRHEIFWRTMPGIGPAIHRKFWPLKPVEIGNPASPHILVIEPTGRGKSLTFGRRLYHDGVEKGAVIVFDGVGTLSDYLLYDAIRDGVPPEDFCLVDVTHRPDELGVPLMYPLEKMPGEREQSVVESFVGDVVSAADIRGGSGFRMSDILRRGARAIQVANPPQPFTCLHDFLTIPAARAAVLRTVTDRQVRAYWRAFEELRIDQQRTWVESAANKISPVIFSPSVSKVLDQTRSTVSFSQIIEEKKRLVINLSEEDLQREVASVWGQMLLSRLRAAVMERKDISTQVTILLDEYSLFHCNSTSALFRLSRNKNAQCILLLQDFGFLDEASLRSLLGNAGVIITNGVEEKDGERLAQNLFAIDGMKRKSWKEDKFYSPYEELRGAINEIRNRGEGKTDAQKRRAVALVEDGLHFSSRPR